MWLTGVTKGNPYPSEAAAGEKMIP